MVKIQNITTYYIEAFFYWGRQIDGNQTIDAGLSKTACTSVFTQKGWCPESDDPYANANEFVVPSNQSVIDAFPFRLSSFPQANDIMNKYLIPTYNPSGYQIADMIAVQLAAGSPCQVSFTIPDSATNSIFQPKLDAYGNYVVTGTAADLDQNGEGHAVVVIDYKPDPVHSGKRLFRFQNSWGKGTVPVPGYTQWPSSTDSTGCAWFTEDFLNLTYNGTQHAVNMINTMMGNPVATYVAQIGPFTSTSAGNTLTAANFTVDPTIYGNATAGYYLNVINGYDQANQAHGYAAQIKANYGLPAANVGLCLPYGTSENMSYKPPVPPTVLLSKELDNMPLGSYITVDVYLTDNGVLASGQTVNLTIVRASGTWHPTAVTDSYGHASFQLMTNTVETITSTASFTSPISGLNTTFTTKTKWHA